MAYGLKYYKEFAWTNYANDTTGNTRIEILENNYSGSSVEIDELGETPVQLRLDNTGDMINQTIKKTSLVLSIIDTDQFDYSQFYTSDGKKYKVNLVSSIANWTGYLVPQSFGQELGTNGLISITASDGLHLLQGIDYVADKNKTLKLADFIADIETKIGLGTFDRSISLATDKGDLWQQFIYEGMFLDKNYEDCLDMVLTAYGLQVRYWKLFPVTSILSHSFSGSVKCLDNVPMVDYLPIAKKLKINQNLTTLPDILEDAMVDDATDVIDRTPSLWKLAKWVTVSDNGLPVYPYKDRQSSENMYKAISMYAIPTNAPYDTQRITGHEGSKYVLREFDSTPFQIEFNANFGRLSVYGRSSATGYQEKLRPISWSQLHWGLYDTKTNKSFSKATNSWSITGRPTYSTANTIRVDNPADSDVTVYINVPKTTGDVLGLELFLFTPSFAYNNPAAEATNGILSINSIKIAEIGGVSENELYNEIKGTITVGDNIDIIEYDYELGTSPSYPTNTSLYYGSSLYNNIYDQITSFTLAGNSVNQMQFLANTILYSNGAGRKSVFSGTFAPMSNGNLMFYKASVNNVNCLINSFTLDVRRVKFVDAEFVEIAPFAFTNYTITSESSIGSSDWGGSGGSSGTVGGGGSTVDTSNFVVKTGAVTQNIEGSVTVEGSVVAGSTNGVLPDDLPVATGSLYGVVKIDDVTIKIDANGKIYAIATGGVSSWNQLTDKPANLTALAALTGAGIVKRNSDGSFVLDTAAYGLSSADVTAASMNATTLTLTRSAGNITAAIPTFNQSTTGNAGTATKLSSVRTFELTGDVKGSITSDLASGVSISTTIQPNSVALGTDTTGNYLADIASSGNGISITGTAGEGATRTVASNATSANTPSTIMYRDSAGTYNATNGLHTGAVVAGALNGTLPDDLPVATSSVFGVIKTGASINNNAGVVNINGRHYTTTSTYTDAAVREITAELALGTGSMANGTLDQIQLSFAPLTTTRGLTANVIATNTGAGMGLKLSFRKDAGTGRWYIMIYNDSGAAVTRDGILLSIRGQQTI